MTPTQFRRIIKKPQTTACSNSKRMKPSLESIRGTIIKILDDMLREWGIADEPINGGTLIAADLGLSSVDALQLLAALDAQLSRKLPYERLLGPEPGQYPLDMTVDQLAAFAFENYDEAPQDLEAM